MKKYMILPLLVLPISFSGFGAKISDAFTLYKSSVNNLMSNEQCSNQEFYISKPHALHDKDEEMQTFSTRFTSNIFVDFYAESGTPTDVAINVSPLPRNLGEQLQALCVISSIQSSLDPIRSSNDYMKLVSDLFDSAVKNGTATKGTSKFSYSASIHDSGYIEFKIEPKE